MGDIARQISAGLRCDSKKLKALQKSHRVTHKSARMTPPFGKRVPLTASPRNEFYFRHACARHSRKFSFSPPPSFSLWRRVKAHRRAPSPKKHRAERRAPPTRERCLLRSRRMRVEPRSSCRACQNSRRGPRIIRRKARSARARSRPAAATICRRFPRRACDSLKLQPALPV